MTEEEYRALLAAGPAVAMVPQKQMLAWLDELARLRRENERLRLLVRDTLEAT